MVNLNPFSSTEATAGSIQRDYCSRINAFFRRVNGPDHNNLRIRDNPLDVLFSWAENVVDDCVKYKNERNIEGRTRIQREKEIAELQKKLEETENKLSESEEKNRRDRAEHEERVESLVKAHSADAAKWENEKTRMQQHNEAEMSKLVGQLLVNQDDNLGWTDDKLKIKFREIQRQLEGIASPKRKEFQIPPNQTLNAQLDPTGFVHRINRGRFHILLKSILWGIINEQFFALSFGFGALGPGNGKNELLSLLAERQRLLQRGGATPKNDTDTLSIFESDKMANNWRSTTFQSIIAATSGNSQISRLHQSNIQHTVTRIMAILGEISSVSGVKLPNTMEREVQQMIHLVGELAFQFGVHPAHLELRNPARGATVQIGPDYQDCEDGDSARGSRLGVDLVVLPGLQKIGDGRSDMSTARTIVPCEIYPVRQ